MSIFSDAVRALRRTRTRSSGVLSSPGDHYTIPAGVEHSAHIHAGSAAMDFYAEPARWKSVVE